jgi:hypothetical protein
MTDIDEFNCTPMPSSDSEVDTPAPPSSMDLETERRRRLTQPRMGQDKADLTLYKREFLKQSKNVTEANICRGFDTTSQYHEDMFEFFKAGLKKYKMWAKNEVVWRKGEILKEAKKDARFDFLNDEDIPRPWADWAINGIFANVAAWIVYNADTLEDSAHKANSRLR